MWLGFNTCFIDTCRVRVAPDLTFINCSCNPLKLQQPNSAFSAAQQPCRALCSRALMDSRAILTASLLGPGKMSLRPAVYINSCNRNFPWLYEGLFGLLLYCFSFICQTYTSGEWRRECENLIWGFQSFSKNKESKQDISHLKNKQKGKYF